MNLLFIEGDIITIDAVGTKTEIVKKVADCVHAIKKIRSNFYQKLKMNFSL